MTLQEIIDLGYTSVTAKASGYQEVGIFGCWQPFKTIRNIVFKINPDMMILEHRTFWINNEETLNLSSVLDLWVLNLILMKSLKIYS